MPAQRVATASDVAAIPLPPPPGPPSAPPPPSLWKPGPVTATPHPRLMVNGAPAVSAATCVFAYTGPPPLPPNPTDPVTLNAKPTVLRCDGTGVLVDGDSVTSAVGNTLKVSVLPNSPRSLRTA